MRHSFGRLVRFFWLRCCTVVPEVTEPGFGGPMTLQMFVAQDQHREPGTKHGAKPVDPPTLPCRGNQFRPKRSRRVRARAGWGRFQPRQYREQRWVNQRREWLGRLVSCKNKN